MIPEEILRPLRVALERVVEAPEQFPQAFNYPRDVAQGMTVANLEAAASNHFFDDNHAQLGITKSDSHLIREYFADATSDGYRIIPEMYESFSGILAGEPQFYLKQANLERERIGLPSLEF